MARTKQALVSLPPAVADSVQWVARNTVVRCAELSADSKLFPAQSAERERIVQVNRSLWRIVQIRDSASLQFVFKYA